MTGPEPLSGRDLDRLLAHDIVPPSRAGLTDRIVAEVGRADRVRALPTPAPRRIVRRPWRRRTIIGIIAINLFAASAIAAAISGHEGFRRLSTFSAHVFHSIAAAIPHRHRVEHPAPHHRPIVRTTAIARPAAAAPQLTTVASPVAVPVPPQAFGPVGRPERPLREIKAERRLERAVERRAERRAIRQERRLEKRRGEGVPLERGRGAVRAERQDRFATRVERAGAGGIGHVGTPAGEQGTASDHATVRDAARDYSPREEMQRSQPSGEGAFDLRESQQRQQRRLARQEWRQRQGFRPGRREGAGFRPRRWRR